MVFTEYTKRRILCHHADGKSAPTIVKLLAEEGITASRRGVYAFLIRSERTGSIARCAGSGRPTKITDTAKEIVESEMRADDERTVKELQKTLAEAGHALSLSTTLRYRSGLGWTSRGSAYCQVIREVNKAKRLAWATENLHEAEAGFLDVIFTDETSVQMESHCRFCCRKAGEPPKNKPR